MKELSEAAWSTCGGRSHVVQDSQPYFSIKASELNTDAPRSKKTPFIAFK